MIYKHEIEAFNEFWLDCDTEMLFSLLVSRNEKYKVVAYRNDYYYDLLSARTPNGLYFHEIRHVPDINVLREKTLNYVEKRKCEDVSERVGLIKKYLSEGYYVLVAVDLYEWVEENMCYQKHHVEHYALLNGFDDEKNTFFTMETDNEKYREFEVTEDRLVLAMSLAETLRYDVVVFEVKDELLENDLYSWKELRKNAKRIIRSIRPLMKEEFWLFTPRDYKALFYRDMTVMYLMQINCRMKANRLLFDFLSREDALDIEFVERADALEKGWIDVRRSVSKLFFKSDACERMLEQNEKIRQLLMEEHTMWKLFLKVTKKK